jgi:short-subunit dehydrogenase
MNVFANTTVIITGAASGIGKALALQMARQKAKLVIADIDAPALQEVYTSIIAHTNHCEQVVMDVADSSDVEQLVQTARTDFGRIDYMFAIAGIANMCTAEELSSTEWESMVNVNILGTISCSMAAYRVMKEQRHGHIVMMSSLAGLVGFPTMTPYAMTKAAIVSFAQNLRAEVADYGIRVTVLCPSFIDSNIYERAIVHGLNSAQVRSLVPFPLMPTNKAADAIIKAVMKKKSLVIFPGYARLLWFLARIFPRIVQPFHKQTVTAFRAIQQKHKLVVS